MADEADDVLGPLPPLPPGVWDRAMEQAFVAGDDVADVDLVPAAGPGGGTEDLAADAWSDGVDDTDQGTPDDGGHEAEAAPYGPDGIDLPDSH